MDVRERDDEAGWGELPGGLAFADDGRPPTPSRRRRTLRTMTWLLVVSALLGGGTVAAARHLGESDVREVLASSTSTYSRVLLQLRQAADAEALAAVAVTAPGAADQLTADLARLSDDGGQRRAAVAAQVAAERDVLLAVGTLEDVDRTPLRAWGDAHRELASAVTAETRTRGVLRVVDERAARRLPDTPATLRRITSTVGEALVVDVTQTAGDLLADLGAATTTADLRAAAGRAAPQRDAVRAASTGLRGTGDARVLEAFAAGLQAVGDLREITPAETGGWPGVRARLAQQLGVVADADDSLAAGAVRGRLPLVLTAVDGLVARVAAAHAAWQTLHDAAVRAQADDGAALRRYADLVRAQATGWAELRGQVAVLDGVAGGQLAAAVAPVAASAAQVQTALSAVVVPAGGETAHGALTAGVAGVVGPVVRVHEQLQACAGCPAAEGPARVMLQEAQSALPAWDGALPTWEAAVTAALEAVAARPLPAPPEADAPPPSAPSAPSAP